MRHTYIRNEKIDLILFKKGECLPAVRSGIDALDAQTFKRNAVF